MTDLSRSLDESVHGHGESALQRLTVAEGGFGITNVTGTVSHGNSITISGSGFGTKSTAAPYKWDDLESYSIGGDPATGGWHNSSTGSGAHVPAAINNDQVRGGSYCTKALKQQFFRGGGITQYGQYFGLTGLTAQRFWYLSYYYRQHDLGGDGASRNHKLVGFRAGTTTTPTYPQMRHDQYHSSTGGHLPMYDAGGSAVYNVWTNAYYYTQDTWKRFEYLVDIGDAGVANGQVQWYLDNVLQDPPSSDATIQMRTNAADVFDFFVINNYIAQENGALEPINAPWDCWIDDVYVDTTRARIEIGDASTWSACTHRELQIPSAWSDTSLTATVNAGTFASFSGCYLYVVDSTGAVSAGYAL